ncbi:MAG: S-layer homology domain-containing protein [Fimbriimonadales bacterium]|nr:S-layer homology domain-containing protein [Fimbriimonadales bacterium]
MWFDTIIAAIAVALQVGGYSDVSRDHWAAKPIENLVAAKMLPPGEGKAFQGDRPVTRYEFAVLMDRFIQDIRKSFLRQPVPKELNLANIKGRDADGSQAAMVRLAKDGFLPYESPIFRGPTETITPEMMSIAMAQIAQRIGQLFRDKDDD